MTLHSHAELEQIRVDKVQRAQELENEVRSILRDRFLGRALPTCDSTQVSDGVRAALSKRPADRWNEKNEFVVEDLARRVVQDSPLLQERGWKVDAGDTRLFATLLKQTIARTIPTLYIPNMTRNTFPVRTDVSPAARTYAHHRVQDHGDLELYTSGSTDIPEITVSAEEDERRLVSFAGSYSWTLEDLEQAAFANVSLNTEKLAALNRAAERNFELVALQGYASMGITGMYNDANIGLIAVLTGTWAGATQAQIVEDIRNFLHTIRTNSETNYTPNRLVIPMSLWQYLGTRNAATDRFTREIIQMEFPSLQIMEGSSRTDVYDVAGTGPRIMGFFYDPELAAVVEARRFQLEPAERRGFGYRIAGRQRLGGASVHHPLTAGYMDGC